MLNSCWTPDQPGGFAALPTRPAGLVGKILGFALAKVTAEKILAGGQLGDDRCFTRRFRLVFGWLCAADVQYIGDRSNRSVICRSKLVNIQLNQRDK